MVGIPKIMVYRKITSIHSNIKSLQISAYAHLSKSKLMRQVYISKSSQDETL